MQLGGVNSLAPLLDLSITQTNAQGSYLYRLDREGASARLVTWSGAAPGDAESPLQVEGQAAREHFGRHTPIVMQGDAWSDRRFAGFPEFQKNRFEGVASIPIMDGGIVVGIANVCRSRKVPLQARELAFLLSLSVPMGALLAATAAQQGLEQEVQKLEQKLADRKLVERAKGLLQSRFEWTEEQAYFHVRRLSRQRRIPMRDVASEVIESAERGGVGVLHHGA